MAESIIVTLLLPFGSTLQLPFVFSTDLRHMDLIHDTRHGIGQRLVSQ